MTGNNGRESHPLRAALEALGGTLTQWTVMSKSADPFRLDTDLHNRNGAWLARAMADPEIPRPGRRRSRAGIARPVGAGSRHAHKRRTFSVRRQQQAIAEGRAVPNLARLVAQPEKIRQTTAWSPGGSPIWCVILAHSAA
jgi:hypothetical protein